jgi:ribose 5-phosphate isomerase A
MRDGNRVATVIDQEKRAVAEAAATLVEGGMVVGLGTGSTIAHLVPLLASRTARDVVYVATSPETERSARLLGLDVRPFRTFTRLDLALDGADQVAPSGWLVKGGGGAHTREKLVAAAAERFVVLVSSNKIVDALAPPVPIELLAFGLESTLHALGPAEVRAAPRSPDGGVLADYLGPIGDPERLAGRLSQTPGVVDHGLFPPRLTNEILVAEGASIRSMRLANERRPPQYCPWVDRIR